MQMPGLLKAAFFAVGTGALGMGAGGCAVRVGPPARTVIVDEGYGYARPVHRERVIIREGGGRHHHHRR